MMSEELNKMKFPIGDFVLKDNPSKADFFEAAEEILGLHEKLIIETNKLTDNDLKQRYRPNGWCIYEVIHHLADSHMNAYIRFKKSLTEDRPQIAGYDESSWVQQKDVQEIPIGNALDIIKALHVRWAHLIKNMSKEDFDKGYFHPESQRFVPLSEATLLYKWHCAHHLAHIKAAKKYKF